MKTEAHQHDLVLTMHGNSKEAHQFLVLFSPKSSASITSKFINNQPLENEIIIDEATLLK